MKGLEALTDYATEDGGDARPILSEDLSWEVLQRYEFAEPDKGSPPGRMSVTVDPALWRGRVVLASLSGNIGVGKSTALKELARDGCLERALSEWLASTGLRARVVIALEDSDHWEESGWLDAFYAGRDLSLKRADGHNRAALPFQMLVFDSHVRCLQTALGPRDLAERLADDQVLVCLGERSLIDQLIFWRLQLEGERLVRHERIAADVRREWRADQGQRLGQDAELCMEEELAERLAESDDADTAWLDDTAYRTFWETWTQFLPPLRAVFYCRTGTVTANKARVDRRQRKAELGLNHSVAELPAGAADATKAEGGGVTLDYLQLLHDEHERFFATADRRTPAKLCGSLGGVPCVPVDADLPYHEDASAVQHLAQFLAERLAPLVVDAAREPRQK